ncbi:SusD-like starch-binding protein associating with outer membrane [Mucilaginibacter auburnensis]|uniref:SusD-like starch-binding protein associating with outer membrane n=2 Tax=Mucilaginibacter auburnensis TaxID=1457233 RepID=A0A2H9VU13_9SPHI|nr:SusD-like starch-binding protein associating with outer membrane [Mucilaginibacter auburnensis]
MKKLNSIKFLFAATAVLAFGSCDKGFVEKNQSPYQQTSIDPAILLSTAQRNVSTGSWEVESTIVQQFVNVFDGGVTSGFQFNLIGGADTYNVLRWNQMFSGGGQVGTIRMLDRALDLAKAEPIQRNNLIQMIRILRAMNYMILVDTYGDVPYSEANKAYSATNNTTPKYDKAADIYTDLYKELKEARAALVVGTTATNSTNAVPFDIFFGTGYLTTQASVQIPKWQRFAGSLLLRMGMRYSKIDANKAQTIIADALSGAGVIASNADNVMVPFNSTDNNPLNGGPRGTNPYYYYLYEPFVNQLKSTNDPRGKYIAAYYNEPNVINGIPQDTVLANQFGFPVGYNNSTILTKSDFKGNAQKGAGFRYSQLNYFVFGSNTAPIFVCTYSQTQLLLAEAAFRGWVTGSAETFYNNGIRASMDEYPLYPNAAAIPANAYNAYIAQPSVAFTGGNELQKINTQYWLASLGNQAEAFANFRRSGYPALTPNPMGTPLPASTGGFARRVPYPLIERSVNQASYQAAVASMGGDDVTQRLFWDKQ